MNTYYVPSELKRIDEHECFITGEMIKLENPAYWTQEFDAYISERGYQMIQNAYSTGELSNNPEWELIFGEWYWKDEAESSKSDDFYDIGGEG